MNPADERYFHSIKTHPVERTEDELMALFCPHSKLALPKGYRAEGELVCPRKGIVCEMWLQKEGSWGCSWIDRLPGVLPRHQSKNGSDGEK